MAEAWSRQGAWSLKDAFTASDSLKDTFRASTPERKAHIHDIHAYQALQGIAESASTTGADPTSSARQGEKPAPWGCGGLAPTAKQNTGKAADRPPNTVGAAGIEPATARV
ncbi:hypothetical protein GCM10009754_75360 [Amycolatopsis minnesotensis]|uniref:Uncharacterized protein n=1 Tax=Amycolatopsis minnesotensis TaxID=337894 RepID=A0ABN2SGN2_9PSEU